MGITVAKSMSPHRVVWLIVLGAALTFSRALSSDYVTWDDDRLVLKNVYLTAPFVEAMRGIWGHSFDGDYFPVPFLSYWLEIRTWGFNPMPQHTVNWLLHLANICLLSVWLSRIRVASGVAVVVTAAPAGADPGPDARRPAVLTSTVDALAGLPLPDRVATRAAGRSAAKGRVHEVVGGDTLWDIAAGELPSTASASQVDRAWRRVAAANRDVVDDPHLIFPGTQLRVPPLDDLLGEDQP